MKIRNLSLRLAAVGALLTMALVSGCHTTASTSTSTSTTRTDRSKDGKETFGNAPRMMSTPPPSITHPGG